MKVLSVLAFLLILTRVFSSRATNVKPNFVIIMTDDQDIKLNGLLPMKKTHELLSQEGMTFTNAVIFDNIFYQIASLWIKSL